MSYGAPGGAVATLGWRSALHGIRGLAGGA